jgi:tetratricopeptide (TPR) repeat protein
MKRLLILIVLTSLASCANPINRRTGMNYNDWGRQAEWAGDYALAEKNYERALINFRIGHTGDADVSMGLYNLGRAKAYLCKFDESEKLLLEALALQEQVSGRESGLVTMRLFELARVYAASKRYQESVKNYEEAIKNVRALGVESSDPIGFAMVLDDYAGILSKARREDESIHVKKEAEGLRSKNLGKQAGFMPAQYGQNCAKYESNT